MNELARSTLSQEAIAFKWNRMFPGGGIHVRFWTGAREGIGRISTTRGEAEIMCGTAVVWIEGVSGCVALSHVEPLRPDDKS